MKTFLDQAKSLAQLQELEDLMLRQGLSPVTGRADGEALDKLAGAK